MAQWIPKTAWKVTNLNKRYGQPYVTKGYKGEGSDLDAYASLHAQSLLAADALKDRLRAAITASRTPGSEENPYPGVVLLDLRDAAERRQRPLGYSPCVAAVHPHDLTSGAVTPILPRDRNRTVLFLVATHPQRAVNGSIALRRLGYNNVVVIDVETASASLAIE